MTLVGRQHEHGRYLQIALRWAALHEHALPGKEARPPLCRQTEQSAMELHSCLYSFFLSSLLPIRDDVQFPDVRMDCRKAEIAEERRPTRSAAVSEIENRDNCYRLRTQIKTHKRLKMNAFSKTEMT